MLLGNLLESAQESAATARIAPGQSNTVDAAGAAVLRGVPMFLPYGICAVPPEGETGLLLPLEGAAACLGVLCPADGPAPGELRLQSAGGARIVLKNNGDIALNGVTITRDGKIEGVV